MNRKKICYVILCMILMVMIPNIVKGASFYKKKSVFGVWEAIRDYKNHG